MDKFQKNTSGLLKNNRVISVFENCELTWLEKYLVSGLYPIVKEVAEHFCLKHFNKNIRQNENVATYQSLNYKKKIDSIIELLEPCEMFLKNYPTWAKQRKETIETLRNVEKPLKDLEAKCHPIFRAFGPKFPFQFPSVLLNLLKQPRILTETENNALTDLKSEVQENINIALKMCARDFALIQKLCAHEFYVRISDSINDLFGDDNSHEILDVLLKFLISLPVQVDNLDNIYDSLRTCLASLLPKISALLSEGFSISCSVLSIFLVVFMKRRQNCAILIHSNDLKILSSVESEVTKLIAAARVKGSKLGKIISSEIRKKISSGGVGNVTLISEMATIILNSIDVNEGFLTEETALIVEITNILEKDLVSYQKTFEMLEKSSKEMLNRRDITNWTTFIIYHVPTDTDPTAIKSAVKKFIREKAKDCMDLERLPTNGNNWLVTVPTNHSRALLEEKYIYIVGEKCLIML